MDQVYGCLTCNTRIHTNYIIYTTVYWNIEISTINAATLKLKLAEVNEVFLNGR